MLKINLLLLAFFLVCSETVFSQTRLPILITPTDSIPLKNPDPVSVDRQNQIYVCNYNGEISRYDSNGKLQLTFSPKQPAKITLLEAWNGLRVFSFSRDLQQYTWLDRFLTDAPSYNFGPELVAYARLMAPAQDDKIWVIDDADFTLKKIDPIGQQIVLNTQLSLVLNSAATDLVFMREYQNLLFILDKNKGIIVFDNMGNLKQKIPAEGAEWFGFSGEDILFTSENRLCFRKLYGNGLQCYYFPFGLKARFAICVGNKIWIFSNRMAYLCPIVK